MSEIIHPKEFFVRFTGDYGKLKSLGYTFQKLYARNYQQWNKDDFRVWRKGGDVTHDAWGYKFPAIFHLLTRMGMRSLPFKEPSTIQGVPWMEIYINRVTYECTSDSSNYDAARLRAYESFLKIKEEEAQGIEPKTKMLVEDWVNVVISPKCVDPLLELMERNWIKLDKRPVAALNNKQC